jgi:hypothetical protein
MAWSASGVFQEFVKNPATRAFNAATAPTNYVDILTDVTKVALFNNTTTPDKDAAVGSTGFNTGVWTTTNEVTDATNWVSGGRSLAGKVYSDVANAMMFDATDLAGGGTLTLAATYGCFVYDDAITAGTVADQGICFNYFGGAQQVTNGTFTIVWHANGVLRFTV